MIVDKIGVHRTHCCALHGCKYGKDSICPVVRREIPQDYLCEDCDHDGINDLGVLDDILAGRSKTCPHCGGIV